jgi:hypothetical protein
MHFLHKPDLRLQIGLQAIIEMAQGPNYRSSRAPVPPCRKRNRRLRAARREFATHRQSPSGSAPRGVYHGAISHAE